jgi:hypothetical protein
MAAPVLAGIPMVYQMLVGAGILAGGAATANKMQKEIQNTIDTNPGIIDEALKNIFMGPARELINPKMLEEIQNVKPTTTAKKKTMPTTEISPDDVMANTLFQEPTNNLFGMIDTPSGTVLAPDATDIEKQRKEAAPKPLITPMPTGQQDQTLSTPIPGQIKTGTETFPAQEPQEQNIGTPVPEVIDTSILTKDKAGDEEQIIKDEPLTLDPRQVKTTGQYVGLFEGTTSPEKLQKIRDDAYQLYDTGKEGRYWYRDSAKTILNSVNGDVGEADKIAQLIGVFSAGSPVGTDLGYALQAYSAYRNGQDIFTGRFPKAQSEKAKRILDGETWEGRKTNNFYKAIAREFNPELSNEPVIDIWMMRAYGFPNFEGTPTEAQYSTVSQELKNTLGQVQKVDPTMDMNQLQAAIWVGAKAKKGGDKDKAAFNYANAIENNLGQISWESAPGASTKNLTGFGNLPYQDRQEYHVEASKVFLDDKGTDILAKTIGVLTPNEFEAPGHYMNETNPGSQTEVIIPKAYKEGQALDKNTVALVDAYAAAKGLVLGQEAVPWHRPFYVDSPSKADGISIRLGDKGKIATEEETKALSQAANRIASDMAGKEINDFNLIGAKEGGRFLNVVFDEKGNRVFTNKQFIDIITKAANEVFPGDQKVDLKYFASDGNYIANDWNKNLNGEDYINTIGQAGPDIQKRILDLLPTLIQKKYQLDRGFGEKHKLSTNEAINLNYRKRVAPESVSKEKPETSTTDKFITKDKVSVTNNLKTQNFLEDKVMNKLLTMRGGSVEGFKELFKRAAPMPASTKAKMEIELQQMLFDKYKINSYPEGESEETINEFRKKYLIDTYNKRMGAIEYISSVAYDVIGEKSNNSLLVVDDDGIPLAGAKIAIPGTKDYNRSDIFSKDALVITEAGSVFKNAGDQLMKDIIQRAKDEGRRFVVAEDLTSEGALDAFMNRGFRTPTTKETKKFKGIKIRRPDGRSAVQKNLVLDLKEIEKNKE